MVSQLAFVAVVALVAVQRLWELRVSARNTARLRARGAVEHAAGQVPWMRALHAAWLVSSVLEVALLAPPFRAWLAVPAALLLLAGEVLRWRARRALGERWSVRILVLPDAPPITRGPFGWIRHPNYLGVSLEILAVPLLHGALFTALVFSLANAAFLRFRIAAEERALEESSGRYVAALGDRPRLIPSPPWP